MRTISREHAIDLVRQYAEDVATAIGSDADSTETRVSPAPCETLGGLAEDVFYVQGNWQMPLPASEQAATLERLREGWSAQGWEIKKFQMFSDTEAVVIAQSPADEIEVMVESAVPPIAVAVVILTPCYRAL